MFWDRVAWVYDIFANGINKKANRELCAVVEKLVSPTDEVLECACGTGLLTGIIAGKCRRIIATDFSRKMLKRAEKKCRKYGNVTFEEGNILQLRYPDESFDMVVAANVLHLLEEPYRALSELNRVCQPGGRIVIPTYLNRTETGRTNRAAGAMRHRQGGRRFQTRIYDGFLSSFLCRGRVCGGKLYIVPGEDPLRGGGSPQEGVMRRTCPARCI